MFPYRCSINTAEVCGWWEKSKTLKVWYYSKSLLVDINIEDKVKRQRSETVIANFVCNLAHLESRMSHERLLPSDLPVGKFYLLLINMGRLRPWDSAKLRQAIVSRTRKLAEHEPGTNQYACSSIISVSGLFSGFLSCAPVPTSCSYGL